MKLSVVLVENEFVYTTKYFVPPVVWFNRILVPGGKMFLTSMPFIVKEVALAYVNVTPAGCQPSHTTPFGNAVPRPTVASLIVSVMTSPSLSNTPSAVTPAPLVNSLIVTAYVCVPPTFADSIKVLSLVSDIFPFTMVANPFATVTLASLCHLTPAPSSV